MTGAVLCRRVPHADQPAGDCGGRHSHRHAHSAQVLPDALHAGCQALRLRDRSGHKYLNLKVAAGGPVATRPFQAPQPSLVRWQRMMAWNLSCVMHAVTNHQQAGLSARSLRRDWACTQLMWGHKAFCGPPLVHLATRWLLKLYA